MPVLTPFELWQQSGRDSIQELFRLEDRNGREYVLPMTHEETVTFHAKEIPSYRQLPQMLYHFSIKERDEPRSRGGLLRLREFIMKDAYSFDRDEAGLGWSSARTKRPTTACSSARARVLGRPGGVRDDGWQGVRRLPRALRLGREHARHVRERRLRGRSRDRAGVPRAAELPEGIDVPKEVATPGVTTIEALAEFLGIDPAATSKAMPVVKTGGTLVLGLVRGDDRLVEAKMVAALGSDFRPATEDEIREAFGAGGGSLGPVGVGGRCHRRRRAARGPVRRGREPGRLASAAASRRAATTSRGSPTSASRGGRSLPGLRRCARASRLLSRSDTSSSSTTRYSKPLGATFLDEDGTEKPLIGGSYGVGPARVMAAAVEQNHDENGIVWPSSIAPYDVHVLALHGGTQSVLGEAEEVAAALDEAGFEVLLDDRDERPGEKFADADLVGCPLRVIVGKKTLDDGQVDVRRRDGSRERRAPVSEVVKWAQDA